MADITANVLKYLKVKETTLVNGFFKLFSVGSVAICILGSLLCAATQYFGEPIECDFDAGINLDVAKQYCWVHGSFWIEEKYQAPFDCRIRDEYQRKNVDGASEAPRTVYYQWVIFFLLLQAALFALPYRLWKCSESGLMKGFDNPAARSAYTLVNEKSTDDLVHSFVGRFNVVLHHNTKYFATFVACEMLNVVVLFVNFYSANEFLGGKFSAYGFEVVKYYNLPSSLRSGAYNPMCETFPTKVSCTFRVVAGGGGENHNNGLCILSQNIVNEKVFLVLYFWYVFLFASTVFFVTYRVATIFLPPFRERALLLRARGSGLKGPVRKILKKCHAGDWFVLNQICKNVDPYFFHEFIWQLSVDIGKNRGGPRRMQAKKWRELEEDSRDGVCLMNFTGNGVSGDDGTGNDGGNVADAEAGEQDTPGKS